MEVVEVVEMTQGEAEEVTRYKLTQLEQQIQQSAKYSQRRKKTIKRRLIRVRVQPTQARAKQKQS
jgi:hypothetical protein